MRLAATLRRPGKEKKATLLLSPHQKKPRPVAIELKDGGKRKPRLLLYTPRAKEPWRTSQRSMDLYQLFHVLSNLNRGIVIDPTTGVKRRIDFEFHVRLPRTYRLVETPKKKTIAQSLHDMPILSRAQEREYLADMTAQIEKLLKVGLYPDENAFVPTVVDGKAVAVLYRLQNIHYKRMRHSDQNYYHRIYFRGINIPK